MTEVAVVGAGPTGLMLAGELALAGVDVVVLERRTTPDLVGTRARGFHARTIEIFDQRGIADRFLAAGRTVQAMSFAGTPLDVAGLPSRHPYTLGLAQSHVERILRAWVEELGVPVQHGVDVTGFGQDADGVDILVAQGDSLRARYLVGADGGRSVVRRTAGIAFVGAEPTRSHLIAEVRVAEEPPTGLRQDEVGVHGISPMEDAGTVGIVVTEQELGPAGEPSLADLSDAVRAVYGTDFGMHDPMWISRFTDATRQAAEYRRGRVLLAGDAAHTHPPTGGQGIGLGVQDAANLGWKLAQVVHGTSPETLLDTYQAERHPVTARILANVVTQAFLQRSEPRTDAIRATVAELVGPDTTRAGLASLLSGLDVAYDLGGNHPLVGRRLPDRDLTTPDGPRRAHELLRHARHVLLILGGRGGTDVAPWADRVDVVEAEDEDGAWELPVVGAVDAPSALLVRPDGHVAWVGDGRPTGLREALTAWCGPPSSPAPAETRPVRSG
jgi:3-(3-hydroxy-phenyl)propionate hydroxylase